MHDSVYSYECIRWFAARRGVPHYWKCKIKHGSPLCERFCAFFKITVFCSEGGVRNLWKKIHKRVAFEVLTSDDLENCLGVKISTSYESKAADVCERCRRAHTHMNGLDRHSTTLALTRIFFLSMLCGLLCSIDC